MACGRLSGPVRTWSRALASGAAREVFEIQRVFARADVFATRSGALRAALSDLCIKTSNGPAKVDISALFTRRAGDATFLAVDPSAGTPIEVPHPSADGPLELVGAWVSRFHDAAHAASAARVVRASAHVQRCFDEAPLAQLARIERVLMVRVPSAMPMPSVELHTGKLYEVRSYTINGFDEDGGSDAAAYSAWLERVVVPSIGEAGGRISGFWMRAPGPVQVTVGGSAAKGPVNPADRVADIFWVAEWSSREQAAAWYATFSAEAYAGNPYAEEGVLNRYERVEVMWSDAQAVRPLIHSGAVGVEFDARKFHTPKP